MNRTMIFAIVILISGFTNPTADVQAQTIDGAAYYSPITDNVQPLIYGNVFSKSYLEKRGAKKSATRGRAEYYPRDEVAHANDSSGDIASSSADFHVRFDPRISREVKDDYMDSIARANGAKAAQGLGSYYDRSNVHDLFQTAVAPYGLRGDDLADVTTAYVVVMWMTANQTGLPSAREVQGVREQMREVMFDGHSIPQHADERQRAAESLIYQTVTLIKVREEAQAQRNDRFLAHLADSAQASMARRQFDLRRLALTEAGMVQR
jgi:hypothetical protein